MIDKWFRSVHEAGHGVIAEHLNIPIVCISILEIGDRSGATVYRFDEAPSKYQNQMRGLGGLAAERLIFGTDVAPEGAITTIAQGDLEKLGMIDQENRFKHNVFRSKVFRHTLRVMRHKKARLIKIASALMEHGTIDAALNPLCPRELQKLESAMPPEFIGRGYIVDLVHGHAATPGATSGL